MIKNLPQSIITNGVQFAFTYDYSYFLLSKWHGHYVLSHEGYGATYRGYPTTWHKPNKAELQLFLKTIKELSQVLY